ncbi:hypothetical protein EPA93_01870 [Ktedonosporobacter rubrisoli]|uniref:DUF4298 domain-containing protein n=1 Tax=Ktedonosporobacter rubrisoli TaxID=2509675 RepID=A0A4P6JIB5_KTERU|nr:hypothetical protein [Ktedonosporobacter rubrisoli]QBD74807.1 hypothetical protein EPA93_01870 [Ktedonosporobacter rubrisoli]
MQEPFRLSVKQLRDEIEQCEERRELLYQELLTRASLQELAEQQFNEMAELAKEGAIFMLALQEGTCISASWLLQRDRWLACLRHTIDDLFDIEPLLQ